jgi:hypothetical protein
VLIKKALYAPGIKKIVLILHSQGALEGSMILDWLLDEVPHDRLKQLEVYTFGNAANHFNNPYRKHVSSAAATARAKGRHVEDPHAAHNKHAIAHIEHYANSKDFVSRWGVLHYARTMPSNQFENRFMGRLFERSGKGHQLNQHYLDNIFPLDPTHQRVRELKAGDFMDMDVVESGGATSQESREGIDESCLATTGPEANVLNDSPTSARTERLEEPFWPRAKSGPGNSAMTNGYTERAKVWQLSRLWAYRNGGSPPAFHDEE